MKKLLQSSIIIFVLFMYFPVFSQFVSLEKAQKVAQNFYSSKWSLADNNESKSVFALSDFSLQNAEKFNSEKASYYIFDVKNAGFIIVSAFENVNPVLGYSFKNKFTYPITSPSVKEWMKHYEDEIVYAAENNVQADNGIIEAWKECESIIPLKQNDIKEVAPLVLTTWDQGQYYNEMCPADANGTAGHVVTGCVATSMAQIMKYYNYPAQGNSSHSYYASSYGTQSANFGATTYNWNNMTYSLNQSNASVAELMYHCGVSVNMGYGADGSSASTTTAADALESYFKYSSSISYKSKYTYTTSTWNTLMVSNLDLGRPMIYSGSPQSGAGHAWVCDGYQGTNSFHMNWGWSGYYDGYYLLDALDVAGDNFNYFQGAVVSIFPASNYPSYCTGSRTLSGTAGTFEDGSGNANYQNNINCSWLIDPDMMVAKIKLSFEKFDTESGNDVVTVYDGASTAAPVLGTFSGSSIPAVITSSSNSMLIVFTSNGTTNASGFNASYTTIFPIYCSNLTNLTAITDTFSDGSGSWDYNPVTSCRWRITPQGATSITLSFSEFNLPSSSDKLEIFDLSTGTVLLDSYTGTTIPAEYTYNASKLMVWFKSNSQTPGSGWKAEYTATVSGIDNATDIKNLNIYPNPANDFISLDIENISVSQTKIKLFSGTGQKVYEADKSLNEGNNVVLIPVKNLAEGIYFLNIVTEKSVVNNRIVIQH